jgi:hypothetical protein
MFTYAVLALAPRSCYRPRLLSSHLDQFGAHASFRAAPPPAAVVRLDVDDPADFAVLAATGLDPDDLRGDPRFAAAVRKALRGK